MAHFLDRIKNILGTADYSQCPYPGCRVILDKQTTPYWVTPFPDGDSGLAMVFKPPKYSAKSYVARVHLEVERDSVLLFGDMHIQPAYRGRGLGNAIVDMVLDIARKQGAHRIVGKVVQRDDKPMDLLAWYRRRGFTVTERREGPFAAQIYGFSVTRSRANPL